MPAVTLKSPSGAFSVYDLQGVAILALLVFVRRSLALASTLSSFREVSCW